MPLWLEVAITVLVGVATGVLSGMFGIGGAVVSTPAIRALGATTFQAIGSTLPSILPSSISGSLRYQREHFILGAIVVLTSVFGVPASVVGSRLSDAVPGNGHALMIADRGARRVHRATAPRSRPSARSNAPAQPTPATNGGGSRSSASRPARCRACSASAAASSWCPPSRRGSACRCKETIATSLACVGIFAIPGTLTHWYLGHIDWTFAIALAIGVIPGAQIGAHFTINADDRMLRYSVGTALGIIALIYAVGEIARAGQVSSARAREHRVEHRRA